MSLSILQFFDVGNLNNENQINKYKKKIEELEKKNRNLKKKLKIWKKWNIFEKLMNSAIISFINIIMIFSTFSSVHYVDEDIFVNDMNVLRARHRCWLNDIIAIDAFEDDEIKKKLLSWSKIDFRLSLIVVINKMKTVLFARNFSININITVSRFNWLQSIINRRSIDYDIIYLLSIDYEAFIYSN